MWIMKTFSAHRFSAEFGSLVPAASMFCCSASRPTMRTPILATSYPDPPRADGLSPVHGFVEKPDAGRARSLIKTGALWNAFIVVTRAFKLLELFAKKFPQTVANMKKAVAHDVQTPDKPDATEVLYHTLINVDFSRDLLVGEESALCVLPVERCGWSDLGTPQRLAKTLEGMPMSKRPAPAYAVGTSSDSAIPSAGFLNLGRQHAQLAITMDDAGTGAKPAVSALISVRPPS